MHAPVSEQSRHEPIRHPLRPFLPIPPKLLAQRVILNPRPLYQEEHDPGHPSSEGRRDALHRDGLEPAALAKPGPSHLGYEIGSTQSLLRKVVI